RAAVATAVSVSTAAVALPATRTTPRLSLIDPILVLLGRSATADGRLCYSSVVHSCLRRGDPMPPTASESSPAPTARPLRSRPPETASTACATPARSCRTKTQAADVRGCSPTTDEDRAVACSRTDARRKAPPPSSPPQAVAAMARVLEERPRSRRPPAQIVGD